MTSRPPPPPPSSSSSSSSEPPSKDELERLRKQTEQHWAVKNTVKACTRCKKPFTYSWWKKRCRNCGDVVCTECSKNNLSLPEKGFTKPVRVCTTCYEKIVGFPSAKRGQLLSQSHGMPRIMYASTSRHGLREDNEDRICVDIKWSRDDQDDMNPRFMAFFGVFDGHSGSDTSQHLKERLPADILARLRQGQLTPNEISHLRTMSRSSRRASRKFEPSFTNTEEPIEEEKKISPATNDPPPLATLFDDPEPSISHIDSPMEEIKHDNDFPSMTIEPIASARSGDGTPQRLSDSGRVSHEKEYSKSKSEMHNHNVDDAEGLDLLRIVQYSCLRTDYLYGQNQLKKPNSERSHSGSCAVFVVFTNAKLKPANSSRLRDAFKWFRRTSDSANEKSVSRSERERSVSRSILDALSPRVSPRQAPQNSVANGASGRPSGESQGTSWNNTPDGPPGPLLASPSTVGVLPWLFARGSKTRPIQSDLSVVCASVGDSEIVMHEKGQSAISLFPKHNWTDPEEERRVRERGGDIREQHGVKRICVPGTLRPTLAVSRSFGDVAFKKGARITKNKKINFFRGSEGATLKEDLVTCAPAIKDISSHVVAGDLNLLVLASDGLWDMFGHEEAIQFIQNELNEHFSKREAKKKMSAKRRASAQDFSPSRQDEDTSMPDPPPLVASTSAPLASNSPPRPPPPPPVSISTGTNGTPPKLDAPTPDSSVTSATPHSVSSTASLSSSPPGATTPFQRPGRAASMLSQTTSTIVIHRPAARRRSESFSQLSHVTSPGLGNLVSTAPIPSPISTASPPVSNSRTFPNSCPTTPTAKYVSVQTPKSSAPSFTSTYPTNSAQVRVSSPPPPPPPPAVHSVSISVPPPPPPPPATPTVTSPSLTVTTPPSPKSHIHVTFASSPQYFSSSSPISQESPPVTPTSGHTLFSPGSEGFASPANLLSPSYTLPSPSQLLTHQEKEEGENALIPDHDFDKGSGEFPPLVTIISPDPSEAKTPSGSYVQPRTAWTDPAPSKQSRRQSGLFSADDSRVEYTGGLDAEEIEDWAALQKICDKLADAAVKRMELQPNLEGDNVSVVIIYFPS